MSKEIAEEYASSLADLTVNSKPLINMLTILAEENIDHAGVIVDTVEKHLEKVHPEIKLPVLYLVDSIIKNVGGAYTQKFSQIIVNMFTRTFKQVDEKIRSQMFKLRETWHDVFPATKLYQLDVKVNLIDPAWPIQAQPQQSNIHVNPNFLKKPVATTSATATSSKGEEEMLSILAKKEQELLMLQQKKIEMELEQTRRQLEIAERNVKKTPPGQASPSLAVTIVNPAAVAPATVVNSGPAATDAPLSAKQRLGPPVNRAASGARIAPVSGPLAGARRDPRLARIRALPPAVPHPTVVPLAPTLPTPQAVSVPPIAPNVFDIKPLDRVTKRKNVITIDVNLDTSVSRDPRRRDVRLEKQNDDRPRRERVRDKKRDDKDKKIEEKNELEKNSVDKYMEKFADPKKINKLPPIPKINRDEPKEKDVSPMKKKKDKDLRIDKKKKRERDAANDSKDSCSSSPEKKPKLKDVGRKLKAKEERLEPDTVKPAENEVVAFKELKNYNKERYMRRNKEKSESPEKTPGQKESELPPRVNSTNVPDVVMENKDVDLRVLQTVAPEAKPALVQKRVSTDSSENKAKKVKLDKFDILFGNEDVDLRQLPPKVDEVCPPPPSITESADTDASVVETSEKITIPSPRVSPKERDWTEVKAKSDDSKKTPTKLDLVRAKLAEATKGKDRTSFYNKQNRDKERRRTISSVDMDLRSDNLDDFNPADNKKTISIIMSQAKQQFNDGQLDKSQYETLMFQVMQINEQLKLKEAKQKESLEMSKLKLKAHIEENNRVATPKSSPKEQNRFGDIDERVVPSVYLDTPPDNINMIQDSDMRLNTMVTHDSIDGPRSKGLLPRPPMMPMYAPPYGPASMWRGQPRTRHEEYAPRRMRGPASSYYRGKFDKRIPRSQFDSRMPMLPMPKMGICQGENPLKPYERLTAPPPLGTPGFMIPPTDFKILEYIDQDPVKTIQIDGILREIRFYGETAVIMLDWDDPREIRFLPGSRRVTFDNKDSVVLSFNEPYKQIEIDDQVFDIRFGAPTRELYINGRWYECLFGAQPMGVVIENKPHLIHLEGPLPQVDIGKTKRTDLVAGKINLIVDGTHMCPLFLDAKVQKVNINGNLFSIRFVDALRTVLINEMPFQIKFGDLPKPIYYGNEKHFIRFSDVPRHVKPGYVQIINMEGSTLPLVPAPALPVNNVPNTMELSHSPVQRPGKSPSPEGESQGLDILASLMPTGMAPASGSEYFLAEPLFTKTDKIPGLETPSEENANPMSVLSNVNVNDLYNQLVATGIVKPPEQKAEIVEKVEEVKSKPKEEQNVIHSVDLLKPETLRTKQPGLVARLYGGMQCSGCGTRFAPEHTVRYSQHLDWHFRQNRRERDSARRAHSRRWHYDMSDWLRYEELEDLDEREKSWFESGTTEGESESHEAAEVPSVAAGAPTDQHCALCGDSFDQFFNEDQEEWHLRNSVRHNEQNYHPLCYEDYKTSLSKEERKSPLNISTDEVVAVEKELEPIEIKDVDETIDQSDNESVVEVVEPEKIEPVEIDEGDEDDVVLKAEPVEQVVVDDDADTDDETTAARAERDRVAEIDYSKIKIKQEPIDPGESSHSASRSLLSHSWDDVEILVEPVDEVLVDDADTDDETETERRKRDELVIADVKIKQELVDPDDEPIITAEEAATRAVADTTRVTVQSSIDGNLQLEATPAPSAIIPIGGIRINITKSLPILTRSPPQEEKRLEYSSADSEPPPPGEEPELEYKIKPNLQNVQFSRQPPVRKGNEMSGLCSIM